MFCYFAIYLTKLTTLLKNCAYKFEKWVRNASVLKNKMTLIKAIENFMLLFKKEVPILINKNAIEDPVKRKK